MGELEKRSCGGGYPISSGPKQRPIYGPIKLTEARKRPTVGIWAFDPTRPTPSSSIRRLGVLDLATPHLAGPETGLGEAAAAPKPYCALEHLRRRLRSPSDPGEVSRSLARIDGPLFSGCEDVEF
jgi:hypothetical protein